MGDYDENQYNGWQANSAYSSDDDLNTSYACTSWAPAVGFAGITFAVVFASKFVHRSHKEATRKTYIQ